MTKRPFPRSRCDVRQPRRVPKPEHAQRREGDEMACSCGARWPSEEEHP